MLTLNNLTSPKGANKSTKRIGEVRGPDGAHRLVKVTRVKKPVVVVVLELALKVVVCRYI